MNDEDDNNDVDNENEDDFSCKTTQTHDIQFHMNSLSRQQQSLAGLIVRQILKFLV